MSSPDSDAPQGSPDAFPPLSHRIEQLRSRAQDFADERREKWSDLEQRLVGELTSIVSRLDAWEEYQGTLTEEAGRLQQDRDELSHATDRLQTRCGALEDQQRQLAERRQRIAGKLVVRRKQMAERRHAQGAALEERVAQLEAEIHALRTRCEQLQGERDQLQGERDRLSDQLAQQAAQHGRVAQDHQSAQDAVQAAQQTEKTLRQQVAQSRKLLGERAAQIKKLRDQLQAAVRQGRETAEAAEAGQQSRTAEMGRLQAERDQLQTENSALRAECQKLELAAAQPSAAAEAGVDADVALGAERQRLEQLQDELREKIRVAEVELAVQRAENGRMRAKLDDKMRELERQANVLAKLEKKTGTGRRWMDHLGLSDPKAKGG